MRAIEEQFLATSRGGIVYDASQIGKPEDAWFEREYWRARGALEEMRGGRGSVAFLQAPQGDWVLRHYLRGGMVAKGSKDRYLWQGADRTRAFSEWRLLKTLVELGLPVPRPIAARYVRAGLTYQADIITQRISPAVTLTAAITNAPLAEEGWRSLGRAVASFHCHGVRHADLNAQNILLLQPPAPSPQPTIYFLDFDRGRICKRGAWEDQVLARLRRSLDKVMRQHPQANFGDVEWGWLIEGYKQGN